MNWDAFTEALEDSAKGAELVARCATTPEQKERALLVSDISHVFLNAIQSGLTASRLEDKINGK